MEEDKLLTKAEIEQKWGLNFNQIALLLTPNGKVYNGWNGVDGYLQSQVEAAVLELRKKHNEHIGKIRCCGCKRWKDVDDFFLLDNYCKKCRDKANRRKKR